MKIRSLKRYEKKVDYKIDKPLYEKYWFAVLIGAAVNAFWMLITEKWQFGLFMLGTGLVIMILMYIFDYFEKRDVYYQEIARSGFIDETEKGK